MTKQYQLLEDCQRSEWQLLREGSANIESIFLSLDDAIRKLPDAVGNISTVVDIFDSQGVRLDRYIIDQTAIQLVN